MRRKIQAERYYRYFSGLPGNKHIANLFAIEKLLDIIRIQRPQKILEIGLGIGSISYSIMDYLHLKNKTTEYHGTEANDFCLSVLPNNLKEYYQKIILYKSINEIDKNKYFDMVIVDGSDDALERVSELISKNGIIFIEGDRKSQQKTLVRLFPNYKFVHTVSDYKEPEYDPFITGDWSGGGKIIYVDPTFKQTIYWLTDKIKSSYRNRIVRKTSEN
jgi:protein-L-isoaspartate O-methyltransferase